MSRKTFAMTIGACVVAAGLAVVPSSPSAQAGPGLAATAPSAFRAAPVDWQRCKDRDLKKAKARCGYLVVPLDYANPTGPTIQLAVSRILHTKGPYRGAAFANPGGPGASALQYSRLGGAIPHGVGKTYDWYGMDPRGVGASIPALSCDPKFGNSQHRPYQPTTTAILSYWLAKTEAYAAACGTSAAKDLLPHLRTTDNVADFESLRTAIGQAQVTYYGFSYGTYLGQVWATLHPASLKAMVLDGVVEPRPRLVPGEPRPGPRLRDRLQEVLHVDRQARPHLPPGPHRPAGRQAVREAAQAAGQKAGPGQARRRRARGRPDHGRLHQPGLAEHRQRHLRAGQPGQCRRPHPDGQARQGPEGGQRVRDVPRDRVHRCPVADGLERLGGGQHRGRPGLAVPRLGNAWFNAPCRTWPVPSNPAPFVVNGAAFTGPVLITNETFDAATPFSGALAVRALFPTSSLIEGKRGTTHAATLSGVSCVDDAVAALLKNGKLPSRKAGAGPDKKCPGLAPPRLDASQPRLGGFETLAGASSSTNGGRQVS